MILRALLLAFAATACGSRPPATPLEDGAERYAGASMWLCRPDLPRDDDVCRSADLRATELRHDGEQVVLPDVPTVSEADAAADCFYVYPTVDLSLRAGNHEDLEDDADVRRVITLQAARFREVCAMFVPRYRQITIGAYLQRREGREPYLAAAYTDVEASFRAYLARLDRGRPIVLVGHSQGAEMVQRLLATFFDGDPALRERLLVAMPLGGQLDVGEDSGVSTSLPHLPLCTRDDQRGCILAFRSYAGGDTPRDEAFLPRPGFTSACTNPADLGGDGEYHTLATSVFPAESQGRFLEIPDGIETPLVQVTRFFSARCETTPEHTRHLAIRTAPASADDPRMDLVPLDRWRGLPLGMHVLDVQLTLGDLIDQVRRRLPR